MSLDDSFKNKSILIIENNKNDPNKTWCFWDSNDSVWGNYINKKWSKIRFKNIDLDIDYDLDNIRYNMINSKKFFKRIKNRIESKLNPKIFYDDIKNINQKKSLIKVQCEKESFFATKVLNSVPKFTPHTDSKSFPLLLQHFKGWTIKTENNCFKKDEATIMDFTIDQKNETRFFYVLPKTENEALVEFTLFSKSLLNDSEYDLEIKNYLSSLNIYNYKIKSKEKGVIPMTCFPFDTYNTKNLINIGTAGGWTKPSSGYTFRYIDKFSNRVVKFLRSDISFKKFKFRDRYWFYDLIFLDVLYNKNSIGSSLFETMFKKNKFSSVFRFLDNEGSYWDDFKIINSFPKWIFIKSFIKNLPKIVSNYL